MVRRPPGSTHCISLAASDVYKRQVTEELAPLLLVCLSCLNIILSANINHLRFITFWTSDLMEKAYIGIVCCLIPLYVFAYMLLINSTDWIAVAPPTSLEEAILHLVFRTLARHTLTLMQD